MNFLVGPGVNVISNSMFKDKHIVICIEDHGKPVVNHCNKCHRPYYDIQNLMGTSALSSTIKLNQCLHSNRVRGYIVAL
jgi:hypothetical protein